MTGMGFVEEAVVFDCKGEMLVGIVSLPRPIENRAKAAGVVIVVGGPQYRAGSHRQFVLLARELAAAGIPVLRFDYRGMGDSTGEAHDFENVSDDIACAIGALLEAAPYLDKVVLWGLCDGASAALIYMHQARDSRVAGLCLLNPWVRSNVTLARTQVKHYYTQRLRQKEFWIKLLAGKVAASAIAGLLGKLRVALTGKASSGINTADQAFQQKMAQAWMEFKRPILLLLSGKDFTAREFLEYVAQDASWENALTKPQVVRQDLENADHTFSDSGQRTQVEKTCARWLLGELAASTQIGNQA